MMRIAYRAHLRDLVHNRLMSLFHERREKTTSILLGGDDVYVVYVCMCMCVCGMGERGGERETEREAESEEEREADRQTNNV